MKKVLVIAPHPDDETIGCGGTLLKHQREGDELYWLIVAHMHEKAGYTAVRIEGRNKEIEKVADVYSFREVFNLGFPTTLLDTVPLSDIVAKISKVMGQILPDTLYIPYPGDVHSDHRVVFNAASACTKWFRYPSVKHVLCYEALSETEMDIHPDALCFRPNVFVDITRHLEQKLKIMTVYASELHDFPFPRSEKAMRSMASVRGATVGCEAAEAFMLLKEIQN